VDDRPVDVRLAEALGWTGLLYDADRNVWEGWNPDRGLPDWPRYSSNYAWCGETLDLNDLTMRRTVDGVSVCGPYSIGEFILGKGPDFCHAVCEWLIAAIAAGVRVVLPGGRVING
jgi:hypothetical protein